MNLTPDNNPNSVVDTHFTVRCPHCRVVTNLTAVAIPRFELMARFKPTTVGVGYRCDSCNSPVFLRFPVKEYHSMGNASRRVILEERPEEVERPLESYELQYLPQEVADDFREALLCYSVSCFNGFAAMCRRCVQSASTELGAEGTSKVQNQLAELKSTGVVDDETFAILKEIMLAGHDGAHPHLPKLNAGRAVVLLELMKDVLYQLFVRQAKIRESMELRRKSQAS